MSGLVQSGAFSYGPARADSVESLSEQEDADFVEHGITQPAQQL